MLTISLCLFLALSLDGMLHVCAQDTDAIIKRMWAGANANKDKCGTVAELGAVFKNYDADDDNLVTESEFVSKWAQATGMSECQSGVVYNLTVSLNDDGKGNQAITSSDITELFNRFDMQDKKDKCVTEDEFVERWQDIFVLINSVCTRLSRTLTLLWKGINLDGDKCVTQNELNNLFTIFDDNNNKKVTWYEFANKWMNGTRMNICFTRVIFTLVTNLHNDGQLNFIMTPHDMAELFNRFDGNDDKCVDRNEFFPRWTILLRTTAKRCNLLIG